MYLTLIQLIILTGSFFLTIQGVVTLTWMLYAWENPSEARKRRSPKIYLEPHYSFTAMVPMRHEERVATDTIRSILAIDYPNRLKEIIIICRHDDKGTIDEAYKIISELGNENNSVLVLVDSYPINKPLSLNQGLKQANNQIVAIFDAEDEPHPDIYNIVNTVLLKEKVDVVQSGVQLMNYNTHWFSALNVMEYFLWFKSGLQFFTDVGKVSFLGGNTVFFKKKYLKMIGGWDENSLTEDADIGIRLTIAGAKSKVIYDERHVTKEETPVTTESFIKQRTRWNHGYLQILYNANWLKLPTLRQKLAALYILWAPFFPIILFLYIPFSLWISLTQQLPVLVSMLSYIPFYILILIVTIQIVGIFEFTKAYKYKFYWYLPFKMLVSYFPYIALLTYASSRAVFKYFLSQTAWEKTVHSNEHRKMEVMSK